MSWVGIALSEHSAVQLLLKKALFNSYSIQLSSWSGIKVAKIQNGTTQMKHQARMRLYMVLYKFMKLWQHKLLHDPVPFSRLGFLQANTNTIFSIQGVASAVWYYVRYIHSFSPIAAEINLCPMTLRSFDCGYCHWFRSVVTCNSAFPVSLEEDNISFS